MPTYENVDVKVVNHHATIEVDLTSELGKVKSGKAVMIGTTRGWQVILNEEGKDGNIIQYSLNLNLVRRP